MEINQPAEGLDPSEYVSSLNTLTGAVTLAAGVAYDTGMYAKNVLKYAKKFYGENQAKNQQSANKGLLQPSQSALPSKGNAGMLPPPTQ